jgi:hypothetical protein
MPPPFSAAASGNKSLKTVSPEQDIAQLKTAITNLELMNGQPDANGGIINLTPAIKALEILKGSVEKSVAAANKAVMAQPAQLTPPEQQARGLQEQIKGRRYYTLGNPGFRAQDAAAPAFPSMQPAQNPMIKPFLQATKRPAAEETRAQLEALTRSDKYITDN